MKHRIFLALLFVLSSSHFAANGQSGGSYAITQWVMAGGGQNAAGGDYGVIGTTGQPAAGTSSFGGQFGLQGGFWTSQPLAPTAAPVSVSGRVASPHGVPIRSVIVELINATTGEVRLARPNSFGYFRFQNVEVGLHVLRARSRFYSFAPTETVVDLTQDLAGVELVATPIRP